MTNPQHEALVEAVARAIEVAWNEDGKEPNWLPPIEFTLRELQHLARAALSATAATPSDEEVRLRAELRRIAEGNLGDAAWQANYDRIREVARAALEPQAKDV